MTSRWLPLKNLRKRRRLILGRKILWLRTSMNQKRERSFKKSICSRIHSSCISPRKALRTSRLSILIILRMCIRLLWVISTKQARISCLDLMRIWTQKHLGSMWIHHSSTIKSTISILIPRKVRRFLLYFQSRRRRRTNCFIWNHLICLRLVQLL